jgi:hypothetical protein
LVAVLSIRAKAVLIAVVLMWKVLSGAPPIPTLPLDVAAIISVAPLLPLISKVNLVSALLAS